MSLNGEWDNCTILLAQLFFMLAQFYRDNAAQLWTGIIWQ